MRFFHNVIKKFLHDQNYKQVGVLPRVYNPEEQKNVRITGKTQDEVLYRLIVWPGYEFRVQSLGQQFFLNVDTSTKFLQQKTVLDRIYELKEEYKNEEISEILTPKTDDTMSSWSQSDLDKSRLVVICICSSMSY